MSVFSIRSLLSGVLETTRRFPTEVLIAMLATVLAVALVHNDDLDLARETSRLLTVSVIACIIWFAAQLSITLAVESRGIGTACMWALRGAATALALVVVRVIDLDSDATPVHLVSLAVATHACIVLAPWIRGSVATWDVGRTLLLRIGTAGIFTSVLTGGLVLAVTSLDVLFDVQVATEVYADINVVCLGLFNTLVVLSGIPRMTEEPQTTLPVALRWFVQFVLIPLVLVFLAILYAYGIRVVFFSDLRGAVAGYVLALNVFALLALVLAWPLRHDSQHRVIGVFTTIICPVLLPMTALLVVAIGVRIDEYGVTPARFAVALLTSFVVLVNLYLLRRSDIDVRALPLVLAILGLATAFGPLGSTQSTVRSQSKRMELALREAKAINGAGVDTLAFQRANDTIRAAFFGAFETIRSVDSAAALDMLVGLHVPYSTDSVSGRVMVATLGDPITSIDVDQDKTYFDVDSPDNEARTVELPPGTASVFTVSPTLRSGRSGAWSFNYGDSLRAIILHKGGSADVDTLSLRALFTQTRASNHDPSTPFLLTSSSGKRTFLVQGGYMRFERGEAPEFRLYGLLVDAEGSRQD